MARITLSESENRRYYEARVPKLHKVGKEHRAPCPLHEGTRDSLAINLETGEWFCHSGCARGGSLFDFEATLSSTNAKSARAEVLRLVGRVPHAEQKGTIVNTYDYTDENGVLLYQTVRYEPKDFRQRRPDGRGDWIWKLGNVRRVLYRLPQVIAAAIVFLVEGERDADGLNELGLVASTNPMGALKWRDEYSEYLRGKQVYVIPDNDEKGRQHAADVMKSLQGVAASATLVELPGAKDTSEWIGKGGTLEELIHLAESDVMPGPVTLADVVAEFRKWLFLPDAAALKVILAAVAANLMQGDPLWLLLVGATGSGKTELLDPLLGLPHMHSVGTLTEAALLSGSPRREKAADASGGLLRLMGDFGFLVLKDFTTVLSMGGEIRAPLLAALREIHDGHWTRNVGVDGGRTLAWKGKCAVIGGCTPAIDQHHALMAMMGERFLLFRMPAMEEESQADRAMQHVSHEDTMRKALRDAVSGLFASIHLDVGTFDEAARKRMAALANFVAHARSAVERDRYHREIDLIPASEMPGRLARSLMRLFQGLQAIGVCDQESWTLASQAGLDCIPDVRRRALRYLESIDEPTETSVIADALGYPTNPARRVLEDLTGHRLVDRYGRGQGKTHKWEMSLLARQLLSRAKVKL